MTRSSIIPAVLRLGAVFVVVISLSGCAVASLAGAMAQEQEYQKLIEVLAEYDGLEGQRFAVVVDADYSTLWQHPLLLEKITGGLTLRIQKNVDGATMVDPRAVLQWQYQTPQWNAMPLGEIAASLNVDRLVYVDVQEFRLNPPGNSFLWEGVCMATIGITERDGFTPDGFLETFTIRAEYPDIKGVGRESASGEIVEYGLLQEFIRETSQLFYTHLEPKYPDRYRPESTPKKYQGQVER